MIAMRGEYYKTDRSIDNCKAYLVWKGYTKRECMDYKDTFSQVMRFSSISLILAM